MSRNILIITQKVDEQDDLLGFFVDWIGEFAKHFDRVFVITLAEGKYDLPNNVSVYSLGKERNNSKIARFFNFYKYLFKLVPQSSSIFAHMSPVFVIASWPVTFIYRRKIILWYLHRSVTFRLKVAEKLCYKIVTASKESLKFTSDKIIETGHGININKFRTDRNWGNGQLKILSVGRISKIKNYETLIESARILKDKNIDFGLKIIGQPVMAPDFEYFEHLKLLKEKLNLNDSVQFVGFMPHNKIPDYYKESDVVVGLTPKGGIDKAILEGMASGCITITSNNACKKYFGEYSDKLIFEYNNPENLAEKIKNLTLLSIKEKEEVSNFLFFSVTNHHDLAGLISKISGIF
ncbi:MAG: hypothetical protein A2735_00490 [Candidatus Yanofskybacteria bacterium RIFCSPHIGHO2_01_FULL_41_21]|uniref:Glycosyl transferase family 1 domain-containing protein n=1 Tax=Candidatus Yanofskybacteria bacterium RIFCSPHIGHO2_01_FULL_41_21 TaxID=1802660 RepID=A0A1F8EBK2_9BACT|nr:MAG: hypothetical protein A2735_00490 [Candidatus Yanofskybacteria bacterium RIFCSPHIGHO2_01_FULL_41_21]